MSLFRQASIIKNLQLRGRIIQAVRRFFFDRNYLEIETPYRIPAPAPEAYIDAEASGNWFLHTSPELCMKRLLAAGYPRIFQICKCFRKNERGSKHLPEFTLLEWYCAGQNYFDMMVQCEELIRFVAGDSGSKDSIVFQGRNVDLKPPWQRLPVRKAFEKFSSISVDKALLENRFDEVMAMEIEPNLGHEAPLFLYDYPSCKASLARLKLNDHSLAERFELYICGLELCNAYSELTDANEQKRRFEAEEICRNLSGKPAYPRAEKFLEALQLMPEASGNAFGIDRLIMLFADSMEIDSVVAFTPEEL